MSGFHETNEGFGIWRDIKDFFYECRYWLHHKVFKKIFRGPVTPKSRRRNEIGFIVCMLIIPIVHFLVFWLYVNFDSILLAFQRVDVLTGQEYYTTYNFEHVFELLQSRSSQLWQAIQNTLITWSFTTLFMFPLSILWSYFLYKKILLGSFFRTMFYIPSIINAVALAAIFHHIVASDGPIGLLFNLLYPDEYVPAFLTEKGYAMKIVLFYVFWTGFGGNLILLNGAMGRVPKEMIESAMIDGIGMWRELFSFILPLSWPTLSTLIIFSFTGLFTSSGPILLLTAGRGETYTISFWIFEMVYGEDATLPYIASAMGLLFTVIGLPIVLIIRHFINKIYEDVEF